jgi:hypothetical protein
MGTGFLMDIDIFHGYGFGTVKPSGFVAVAISTPRSPRVLPLPETAFFSGGARSPSPQWFGLGAHERDVHVDHGGCSAAMARSFGRGGGSVRLRWPAPSFGLCPLMLHYLCLLQG